MIKIRTLVAAALLALCQVAAAQTPPDRPPFSTLGGYVSLSAANSAARTALPASVAAYSAVTLYNSGTKDAFFAIGDVTVVASVTTPFTNAVPVNGAGRIPSGTRLTVWAPGAYISVVTANADTTTVQLWQGSGPIEFGLVGGGGGATACAGLSDAGPFCSGTDAGNLTGTVASARLTGAYGGITGLGTLTSLTVGAGSAMTSTGPGGALTASAYAAYTGPYLPLTGGTLSGALSVNLNTGSAPAMISGGGLQVVGADATVGRVTADSFGAIAAFTVRRAEGTAASPTAVTSGIQLGGFNSYGYRTSGGAGYSGPSSSVQSFATENWTSTANGTKVVIATTPNLSTTLTTALTVDQDQSATLVGAMTAASFAPTSSSLPVNGMYLSAGNNVSFSAGSSKIVTVNSAGLTMGAAGSALIGRPATSGTVPAFYPNQSNNDGIGSSASGLVNIISASTTRAQFGTGAASVSDILLPGTLFTGGTGTTTFPQLFVQPTGTTAATTWSTSGTIIGANVVSGFAGNFLDFHVAGAASVLSVASSGAITTSGQINVTGSAGAIITGGIKDGAASTATASLGWSVGVVQVKSTGSFGFSSTSNGASAVFNALWTSPGAGIIQNGAADTDLNASIVAQTLRTQGALTGGTTNQAGKDFTLIVSPGKGTGAGGSFIVQTAPAGSTGSTVNAPVTALTISSAGVSNFAASGSFASTFAGTVTANYFVSNSSGTKPSLDVGYTASGSFSMASAGSVRWSNTAGDSTATGDLFLLRDAANVLAQRNGTTAQTFNVYNTYTDASNYERLSLTWSASVAFLETEQAGTGSSRSLRINASSLQLQSGGTTRWQIDGTGNLLAATDNSWDIGASGATRPRNLFVASAGTFGGAVTVSSGNFNVNAAGGFVWSARSILRSPSDGVIGLYNQAETDFGRLQFGGTTSSFPAIKRSGAQVAIRLADDSGSGLPADTAQTDSSVCATSAGLLFSGSGTLGVCLGTSSARYKDKITVAHDGLAQVLALQPKNFFYKRGHGDGGAREQYGFTAEDMNRVLPKLTHLDTSGKPNSVDLLGLVPVLTTAIQEEHGYAAAIDKRVSELKADNDNLRAEVLALRRARP